MLNNAKPIYINDRKAAEYLGLSTQTLRNWRCQNQGPAYVKLVRSVRYRVDDLDTYMKNRTVCPGE